MSSGNANIGKPAPGFKATAVVDGQFKDIQLSDYKGKCVCFVLVSLLFMLISFNLLYIYSEYIQSS